jgi:hypothetical protein
MIHAGRIILKGKQEKGIINEYEKAISPGTEYISNPKHNTHP